MDLFKEKCWSLISPDKSWRLDRLSHGEIELILATMTPEEAKRLWIWKKGWTEWKRFELEKNNFRVESRVPFFVCPEVPEDAIGGGSKKGAEKVVKKKDIADKPVQILRKFPRFDIVLPVKIVLGTQNFSTKTKNISLGGICLQDSLPGWVAGYCTVLIHTPEGEQLELLCTVVEDQSITEKFRMEIVPSTKFEHLKKWMEDWVEKNLKVSA